MMRDTSLGLSARHWRRCLALLSCSILHVAMAIGADQPAHASSRQEEVSTLVGNCPNGEPYRLRAYRQGSPENLLPFYDYEGPAGRGTVQVDTLAQVMAVRICIRNAEIINRDYLTQSW